MQDAPAIPTGGRNFAIRIAVFYATLFALAGAYMPFFPLWLQAVGLDAAAIGLVVAMPTVARLIAVPVVTGLAERRNALRGAMIAAAMLAFAGFLLLGTMGSVLSIMLVLWLTAWAWTPIVPLADAYALRGVVHFRRDYGRIRLWGSVAFVGGVVVAGLAANYFAATSLIWVIAAIAGLCAIASLAIAPLDLPPQSVEPSRPLDLLKSRAFLAVIFAAALIQGSHAAYYIFSVISWRAEGFSSTTIAGLWALCVIAEIVLFAFSPRLGMTATALVIIGGVGAVLRWLITAQEPPLPVLAVAQVMHVLSFAATHLGTMRLLARLVPGGVMASAQGYLVTLSGAVMSVAGIVCGWFYASAGQSIYYGMAAMGVGGAVIMMLARPAIRRAVALRS